jgi:hypothetical protein
LLAVSSLFLVSLKESTTNSSSSGVNPDEAVFTSKPNSLARNNMSAEATSSSLAI